jgi:hypothetical protein
LRTPETHYIDHGFIKFFKNLGVNYFTVYFYAELGDELYSIHTGKLEDKVQLKKILLCKNQKDMRLLVRETTLLDLGDVKQC